MDEYKPYKMLADGMVNRIVPARIQIAMSGCCQADQNNKGEVTLTYTDGTTETAPLAEMEIALEENFFAIVSAVQEKRNPTPISIAHVELDD